MLLLARVDGKSPVEYLTEAADKSFVRAAAMQMIVEPPGNLEVLAGAYFPLAGQRSGVSSPRYGGGGSSRSKTEGA